jgi:hypothetical protein
MTVFHSRGLAKCVVWVRLLHVRSHLNVPLSMQRSFASEENNTALIYTYNALQTRAFSLKSLMNSLDFTVDQFFMKLFKTSTVNTVNECRSFFMFKLPSVLRADRCQNFEKYDESRYSSTLPPVCEKSYSIIALQKKYHQATSGNGVAEDDPWSTAENLCNAFLNNSKKRIYVAVNEALLNGGTQ